MFPFVRLFWYADVLTRILPPRRSGSWDGYLNLRRSFGLGRDGRGSGVAIVFPVVWVGGLALVFWALNACMDELRKLEPK